MTNPQFKTGFNILYNNITSNQTPGLNEEEMSFFLNKAQEEVLKNHINPRGNKYGAGYDDNSKRQIEFSTITKSTEKPSLDDIDFDDLFYILNESVEVTKNEESIVLTVIPLSYDEWDRLKSSPYPYPLKKQAWRVINDGGIECIIHPDETFVKYTIRYIKKPSDINLSDNTKTCELPKVIHQEILQRAVELAKLSWEGNLNAVIMAGQNSE